MKSRVNPKLPVKSFYNQSSTPFAIAVKSAALMLLILTAINAHANTLADGHQRISLDMVQADPRGGYGYKLQYYVPVPLDSFWQFKTDFSADFLLTSDELIGHRLIRKTGNGVITENRYASAPELKFLWETTVFPEQFRLVFRLLNASDCRHAFHYGVIQLKAAGDFTQVTQVAYFDFFGASFWVRYPWQGGMKKTLTSVARWEQNAALEFGMRYLARKDN